MTASGRTVASRSAGRPRGNTGSGTAETLIEAALETFAEVGYDGAGTRVILGRAGVTAPVLYHHFGTKAGLFVAVARHVRETVVGSLRAAATEGDLTERLAAALVRSAELQAENRALVRFLVTAPLELRFHPELGEAVDDLNGVLAFVTDLCREHAPPGTDPEAAARVARVHLHGLARVAAVASAEEFRRTVDDVTATLGGPPFRVRADST